MKDPSSKWSRMRLELCDYDLIIEYLKGRDNVVADALSRIDFQVYKDLLEANSQILALTRSKTRDFRTPVTSSSNNYPRPQQSPQPRVAHSINNRDVLKTVTELVFSVANSSGNLTISCTIKTKTQPVVTTQPCTSNASIDNGNAALKSVFALLNTLAVNNNIAEAKLRADDSIFFFFHWTGLRHWLMIRCPHCSFG